MISGMPTATGSHPIGLMANHSSGCQGSQNYTLVVNCPPITVEPIDPTLKEGKAGEPYSQKFTAKGGTPKYSFAISGNSHPDLKWNPPVSDDTWELAGTP